MLDFDRRRFLGGLTGLLCGRLATWKSGRHLAFGQVGEGLAEPSPMPKRMGSEKVLILGLDSSLSEEEAIEKATALMFEHLTGRKYVP